MLVGFVHCQFTMYDTAGIEVTVGTIYHRSGYTSPEKEVKVHEDV